MSWFFTSGGQSIGASVSESVLPMSSQGLSPLGWANMISLQSKGFSSVFSRTTIWKQNSAFFMVQLSHLYMTTGKIIALTIQTHVRPMSTICHSFYSKEEVSFNFMASVTFNSDFWASENKICHSFHFPPFYLPWSDGTGSYDLSFLNVAIQISFFQSPLSTLFKRLFNSSSLSAIREVSSAYLRLLIFLPATLIPAFGLSSPALHMMYSAYKLIYIAFTYTFPNLKQVCVSCLVLSFLDLHTGFSGDR